MTSALCLGKRRLIIEAALCKQIERFSTKHLPFESTAQQLQHYSERQRKETTHCYCASEIPCPGVVYIAAHQDLPELFAERTGSCFMKQTDVSAVPCKTCSPIFAQTIREVVIHGETRGEEPRALGHGERRASRGRRLASCRRQQPGCQRRLGSGPSS